MALMPFQPTPFFADKNRAFWTLQYAGWGGVLLLRAMSAFANDLQNLGGGYVRSEALSQVAAGGMHVGVLVAGVAWTLSVTLYLLWHFLSRHDEERLLAALRVAYPDAVGSRGRARSGR